MWAARLSDPELIDRLEQEMREHGQSVLTDMRPPLLGFDSNVAGLLMITNQLISQRIEGGNGALKHIDGPQFPMEIANERLRKFAAVKRASVIEQAQARSAAKQAARSA